MNRIIHTYNEEAMVSQCNNLSCPAGDVLLATAEQVQLISGNAGQIVLYSNTVCSLAGSLMSLYLYLSYYELYYN